MKRAKQRITLIEKAGLSEYNRKCVTEFNTYSNRVMTMEINLQGKDSVTVINTRASTSGAEDKKKVQQFL